MPAVRQTLELPDDPSTTEKFGEWLGAHLAAGDVLGLVGELGAGKTTLVRGLARGLRTSDPAAVSSPSYLLVVEHPGPVPLVHADAYLPAKLQAFLDDGGLEYLLDPRAVVVVEWAEKVRKYLPEKTLWLELRLLPSGGRGLVLTAAEPAHFPFLLQQPKMGWTN